jgi:hypothetical protein
MAIQTASLSSAEHDWYVTRSGITANAPLNDHKRAYFVSKGITGANKKLSQMEWEWLHTLTGVTADRWADMWIQAVAGQSLTPVRKMDGNKFIFYSSVTGTP